MRTIFFLLIALVSLVSCQQRPKTLPNRNAIHKIVIAGSNCFGSCPEFTIEVDSSLRCAFYGGKYAKRQGFYRGKVSLAIWNEVVMRINSLAVDSLLTEYPQAVDKPLVKYVIYTPRGRKMVVGTDGELPTPLFHLYGWFVRNYTALPLNAVPDSIDFGTSAQLPNVAPPPTIKFGAGN